VVKKININAAVVEDIEYGIDSSRTSFQLAWARKETSVGLGPGRYVSRVVFPADFIGPLSYTFKIFVGIHNIRMMHLADGVSFKVNCGVDRWLLSGVWRKLYYRI